MTLPLRAVFPGPNGTPVKVEMRDDGAVARDDRAERPGRVDPPTAVPLKHYDGRRRFRRIDLSVSRVVPPFTLGVMTGRVTLR